MPTRVMSELGGIAQNQWGLVTARQAQAVGVSRLQLSRLADGGALERVAQGIYRLAGAPPLEHQQIVVAWIALDGGVFSAARQPDAVVAGTAAARVHEIGDFWMESIDFFTPTRRVSRRSDVRTRIRVLTRNEYTLVNGMPTLTAARTIADLVERSIDESLIVDTIRNGLDRGIVNTSRLAEHMTVSAGRRAGDGAPVVTRMLKAAGLDRL